MAEDVEHPPGSASQEAAPAPRRRRSRWKLMLAGVVLVPILLFVLYTWSALRFSYSQGSRAGYVQKFSRKGWMCKTWEGELAMANLPGTLPEIFKFTVRNDSVAARITKSMGSRVALAYRQHRGVPTSCFGETEYYVYDVQPAGQP